MHAKVYHTGTVKVPLSADVEVTLTENDIFNWLTHCDNPNCLEYLGKYALKLANNLRAPDDDDFRSRA